MYNVYKGLNNKYVGTRESLNFSLENYSSLYSRSSGSSDVVSTGRYRVSKLENLGDYKVMGGEPIQFNVPTFSFP